MPVERLAPVDDLARLSAGLEHLAIYELGVDRRHAPDHCLSGAALNDANNGVAEQLLTGRRLIGREDEREEEDEPSPMHERPLPAIFSAPSVGSVLRRSMFDLVFGAAAVRTWPTMAAKRPEGIPVVYGANLEVRTGSRAGVDWWRDECRRRVVLTHSPGHLGLTSILGHCKRSLGKHAIEF
jgi:hypothetical protein